MRLDAERMDSEAIWYQFEDWGDSSGVQVKTFVPLRAQDTHRIALGLCLAIPICSETLTKNC